MARFGVSSAQKTSGAFRPDIEGLRAFAVVAVILNHMFVVPRGGFIGVDVFYVLSGFLITGLLLREHAESGWISFTRFYARRAKRILPAAVLVLSVTVTTAYLIWYEGKADQVALDALAALFFVGNWHFVRTGTDYLQASSLPSPIEHYWSLSVEEQFYVVWPALILLTLFVASRGRRDKRSQSTVLKSVIGLFIAASFGWAMFASSSMPTFAYFDTVSRVWELAAGGMLAVLSASTARIPPGFGAALAWVGLAILVCGAFAIGPDVSFPGPWAIVPVIASCMIIAGGSSGKHIAALANPASRYIGRISYSLYLWHFPIIVFISALTPSPSIATYALMGALMLGISIASYHLVEDPLRRSKWLRPRADVRPHKIRQIIGAALIGVLVVGLSAAQLKGPSVLIDASALRPTQQSPGSALSTKLWADADSLSASITKAAEASAWPAVSPSLGNLGSASQAEAMDSETGCRNQVADTMERNVCDRPGQGSLIVVIGDSVAMSWMPAVEKAFPDSRVVGLGFAGCTAIPVALSGEQGFTAACTEAQDEMFNLAAELRPDVVITSSAQSSLQRLVGLSENADAVDEWGKATGHFFDRFSGVADTVIILGNPPAGIDPDECLTRFTGPGACVSELDEEWKSKARAEADRAAADVNGGRFIDVRGWFCTASGDCPMFADGTILRFDGAHLTQVASERLGGVLRFAATTS